MIIGKFPFERHIEPKKIKQYQAFVKKINLIYNQKNFTKTYLPLIYEKINLSEYNFLEVYVFNMFVEWIRQNEEFSQKYINKYNKLIKLLKIESKFYFSEKAYLEKISGIEFTINRKLKSQITYFDLLPNEIAYFVYNDLILKIKTKKKINDSIRGNLVITNQRLAFIEETGIYFFKIKKIKILSLKSNSISIILENMSLNLETDSPEIIYISIDRIIAIEGFQI